MRTFAMTLTGYRVRGVRLNTMPRIEPGQPFQFLAEHQYGSRQADDDQIDGQYQTYPKMDLEIQPPQPHPLRPPDKPDQKTHGDSVTDVRKPEPCALLPIAQAASTRIPT